MIITSECVESLFFGPAKVVSWFLGQFEDFHSFLSNLSSFIWQCTNGLLNAPLDALSW